MKKDYLKWVTRWMSPAYKDKMRSGINTFYDAAANESGESISSRWSLSDPNNTKELQQAIEEETLALIEECIMHNYAFGDVKTTVIADGNLISLDITLPIK